MIHRIVAALMFTVLARAGVRTDRERGATRGFMKVLVDAQIDTILGAPVRPTVTESIRTPFGDLKPLEW